MVENPNAYFNELYDAYFLKIKGYVIAKCNNLNDVEDIMQETFSEFFLLICKKGADYIKNAEAMLMHIAKVKIYKHYSLLDKLRNIIPLYNKNKEGVEREKDIIDYNVDIEQKFINEYIIQEVWEIIRNKPKLTQRIFALYYYCDKTIKEISKELKISESNVKHRLYRTLEELRKIYSKEV